MGDDEEKYMKFLQEFDNRKLMERISDETVLNFNTIPSTLKQIMLLTITPDTQ